MGSRPHCAGVRTFLEACVNVLWMEESAAVIVELRCRGVFPVHRRFGYAMTWASGFSWYTSENRGIGTRANR